MDNLLSTVLLRRLQVFLEVCETLHMARAAEKLGVAQPALSQQIRALEAALGARLFNRRKRGIDLSAAGEALREDATRLIALHARAIDTVRRTARGETGALAIGYVASALFEPDFPVQLKMLRDASPDIEVSLREDNLVALFGALRAGELDLALVRAPVHVEAPLTHRLHSRQRLMVVLPAGHPLAALKSVPLARLADEPLVGFPDPEEVGIMRVLADLARAAGVTLAPTWRVPDVGSILGFVAAGLGYGIVPETMATLAGPGIESRPLAGRGAQAALWLVWHAERETPAIRRFLSIAATAPARSAGL